MNALNTIQTILAGNGNTNHRWAAALAVVIPDGQRGAPRAREIQAHIRGQWEKARSAVAFSRHCGWVSPVQRADSRRAREMANQARHQLLMDDQAAGWPMVCLGMKKTLVADITAIRGNEAEYARVGEWVIAGDEDVRYCYHAYSKAWHRRHGGKEIVERRTVLIRRMVGTDVDVRDIEVPSFRGNWALKALINSGVITPVKVARALKPVQLHEAFEVRLVRTVLGVSIYERTLAGAHYDFCAVAGAVTFHAATIRDCLHGLHKKNAEIQVAKNSPINWELCRQLEFCETGIRQFCSDFGLSVDGDYSPEKILEVVKNDLETAAKYESELRKVAKVLDFQFSI